MSLTYTKRSLLLLVEIEHVCPDRTVSFLTNSQTILNLWSGYDRQIYLSWSAVTSRRLTDVGGVWWICLTHLLPKGNTIDISACIILWMYILGVTSYMFPTCTVVLVGVLSPRFHNCMHCQQVTVTQNPPPTTLPFHPVCVINCFHYTNVSATFITVSCLMHLVTWCDVSLQSGITVGQGCTTWRCVWWMLEGQRERCH